jgi:hypothetical protein
MPEPTKAYRRPPTPRLDSIAGVRRELARLYREARASGMDVGDASKLANILQILGRMIEGAELERRLGELERRAEGRR